MLDLYRIFIDVVRSGSIQKSAANLNYSASGISYALTRLENHFNTKLLVRDKAGVSLTSNGRQLYPLVLKILDMQNNIESEAALLNGLSTGTVRLGTLLSASSTWIPYVISRFKKLYPGIEVKVIQRPYQGLSEALLSGETDISFARPPLTDRLQVHFDILDPLFCATPRDYMPKNRTYMTADDLREKNYLIAKELFLYEVSDYFSANNIQHRLDYMINSDFTNLIMVESGLGFSIFPYMFLKRQMAKVNVYPIQNGPIRKLVIATQKEEYISPATRAMLNIFHEYWQLEYSTLRDLYSKLYPELIAPCSPAIN